MSKLVPLQIAVITLTVVSIILSVLYHLSVEAVRMFPQQVAPSDEPTWSPPPDPKPPLFTPFGILSIVALLSTLVIHCAQPDYLAPRQGEGAEEKAIAEQGTSPAATAAPSSTSTLPRTKSKNKSCGCFPRSSSIISYPRPPLPRAIAEAIPCTGSKRWRSTWFVARVIPWLVLLLLWVIVCVGWFVFLYSPRYKTYTQVVPADGWRGWFQIFNTNKIVTERWVGPYQCRSMELSCQLLLAQAILSVLLMLLLVAEMIILYVGQKALANAPLSTVTNEQSRAHQPTQPEILHPRGEPRPSAVKPLPSLPAALPAPPKAAMS